MTIEEKAKAIEAKCDCMSCSDCPVKDHLVGLEKCYSAGANIERNYELMFGNQSTESDNVNHPSHYKTGNFECIDVMIETQGVEAVKNFCICNAFKYLYRHNGKNDVEDIKKAKWYIEKYLELEGEKHA